jgi:hypothetical protein
MAYRSSSQAVEVDEPYFAMRFGRKSFSWSGVYEYDDEVDEREDEVEGRGVPMAELERERKRPRSGR